MNKRIRSMNVTIRIWRIICCALFLTALSPAFAERPRRASDPSGARAFLVPQFVALSISAEKRSLLMILTSESGWSGNCCSPSKPAPGDPLAKTVGPIYAADRRALKRNGLPDDLKYVVIGGERPAASRRLAEGRHGVLAVHDATGRNYGLAIEDSIDERRNIFASTEAAVRYLKKLYADFGSWTLAAAAYNMGEEGLKAEMIVQRSTTTTGFNLPLETQQYVPRIVVVKLILADPVRYGFNLNR